MTRPEATGLLNAFLARSYPRITLTDTDLIIDRTPGVWTFKMPCVGDVCQVPHPDEMKGPIFHRVVFMEYQTKPAFEVWETLRNHCRTCGGIVFMTQEAESQTFHFPDSVTSATILAMTAHCEKCGMSRVWV